MFCYQTAKISVQNKQKEDFTFNPLKCDATKCFLDHYSNLLFLTFMNNNGTITEKKQAQIEIEICHRKMNYWKRQPHFEKSKADDAILQLNKQYQNDEEKQRRYAT